MSWEGYGVKQSMRVYLKKLSDISPVLKFDTAQNNFI
jgi:hypothetical protein